jgi:hypothetical protein
MTANDVTDLVSGMVPVLRERETAQLATLRAEWAVERRALMDLIAGLEQRLVVAEARAAIPGPAGKDGLPGRDGKDGRDGIPGGAGAPGTKGMDGRDGHDGIDGPAGKDGVDGRHGKDGLDGLGFDDLDLGFDPERGWQLCFTKGALIKRFPIPVPWDAGVWQSGRIYPAGAGVTVKGAFWIAQQATTARPGDEMAESRAWRLAVKPGRDGKPGKDGQGGEP